MPRPSTQASTAQTTADLPGSGSIAGRSPGSNAVFTRVGIQRVRRSLAGMDRGLCLPWIEGPLVGGIASNPAPGVSSFPTDGASVLRNGNPYGDPNGSTHNDSADTTRGTGL